MAAFSSKQFQQQIRTASIKIRKKLVTPVGKKLLNDIKTSENPRLLAAQAIEFLMLSNRIACPTKPSFTMEEAAENIAFQDPSTTPYICSCCGFVHFGHESDIFQVIREKVLV
jgi:hypothetical protein